MITQLQTMIDDYAQQAREASLKTSAFAVIMGNREDTKHPCHTIFYDGVKDWAERFAAAAPEQAELCRVLEMLLLSAAQYEGAAPYWYLIAVQSHAKPLISLLDEERRSFLLKSYEKAYPRDKLVPIQEEIVVLLGGRKKRKLFGFL